jgi:vancomycin aglycone glucosyltransferase
MRVLLSTIGSRGDVQPLVALASELRAAGAEVRLCVPPDFREGIAGLGLEVTSIGPELRSFGGSGSAPGAPTPERRRQLAESSVAAQFAAVGAAAEGCDTIVAATALQIAARSVAEKNRIPYIFVAYCPVVLPSPHHAPPVLPPLPGEPPAELSDNRERWARDRERFHDLFGAALNHHRASIGLPPVADTRSHVFTERPWLAADRVLAPWPDRDESGDTSAADLEVVQTGAWILPDQRPLSRDVEAFLEAGAPPVYIGFGSMRTRNDLGAALIETARALGRRTIVSRGWADLAPVDRQSDCLAIDEVNQQALFKRVAVVVHHGGAGTTTVAALAGAPQMVIPHWYDQLYFAQRIRDLGVGTAHPPAASIESLAETLGRALRPEVAARARSVAASVRRDGARAAAERVLSPRS